MNALRPKPVPPSVAPAAAAVADLPRSLGDAKGLWAALVATGMDRFMAIETAAQGDRLAAGRLWLEALHLVEIPAGTFHSGSLNGQRDRLDYEGLDHEVRIALPFQMSAFPATQGAWEAMMGGNPSHVQAGSDFPVENVSWDDICGKGGFLERLNAITEGVRPEGMAFRLPSEAECEYACLAGTASAKAHRPLPSLLMKQGWFRENSGGQTHSVGQKAPNPWGLHDLYGNVSEWCQDAFHPDYQGVPVDGTAWAKGGDPGRRVQLGGSWAFPASLAYSNSRSVEGVDVRSNSNGFRPVLGAPHGDGCDRN